MRKKRVAIAIAVMSAAVLGLLVWLVWPMPPREPVYQGHTLSYWADEMATNFVSQSPFREAVRSVGTDAIPVLLRLLRAHDSPLKIRLLAIASKQPWFKVQYTDGRILNVEGYVGFKELTNRAASAVPELVRIYELKISPASQRYVAASIVIIGSDAKMAVPALLRETANTNEEVRASAFAALASIHENPDAVVPLCVRGLGDPSILVQEHSARGLGNFGAAAQAAVPALVDYIQKAPPGTPANQGRPIALDALKSIDPAAAEKFAAESPKDEPGN